MKRGHNHHHYHLHHHHHQKYNCGQSAFFFSRSTLAYDGWKKNRENQYIFSLLLTLPVQFLSLLLSLSTIKITLTKS